WCDDGDAGNDNSYDGCSPSCQPGPFCGDGVLTAGEEDCDNGVNISFYDDTDDACAPGCELPPYCGDGELQPAQEWCDEGDDGNEGEYDGCTQTCELGPYCGDGQIDEDDGEACDDGLRNAS